MEHGMSDTTTPAATAPVTPPVALAPAAAAPPTETAPAEITGTDELSKVRREAADSRVKLRAAEVALATATGDVEKLKAMQREDSEALRKRVAELEPAAERVKALESSISAEAAGIRAALGDKAPPKVAGLTPEAELSILKHAQGLAAGPGKAASAATGTPAAPGTNPLDALTGLTREQQTNLLASDPKLLAAAMRAGGRG